MECTSAQNRAQEYLDSRAHEESSASSEKSTGRRMSKVKEDQIEQWRMDSAERRKKLTELEKQTELVKQNSFVMFNDYITKKYTRRNYLIF